ncbi:hypothetical protein J2Z79_001011 [Symbiobacterium terraclitae]|uniref:Uncharacterized protein n=1 Tax=Symbiobacterium terraclitae TaxID=557451 RepID=A0ABS4JRV3_9FIRM|nr:hypothetical protein [Symbiobacterium terraclitae]MBP2017626.1 hypothetical protein [Symbiobacterium terraclitae]
MPNFREFTPSEILAQMPQARMVLAKHFGDEGIRTASGFRLRDLAQKKDVELSTVIRDLKDVAKSTGTVW